MEPGRRSGLVELLDEARVRGDLGPEDPAAHVAHAEALARLVADACGVPRRVLDLGSGAGIPGLVLAEVWPRTAVVLLEGRTGRAARLRARVEQLGAGHRVSVRCGRAEALGHDPELRGGFDVVVARSFGAPAVTAELGVPFVGPGGHLVVSEPQDSGAGDVVMGDVVAGDVVVDDAGTGDTSGSTRWPAAALASLGLAAPRIETDGTATAAIIARVAALDARWPRRTGIPAKRPLWR